MTDIIYTLVYIIPLLLVAISTAFSEITDVSAIENPKAPLIVMLLTVLILAVIINVENRLRVILSGSLLALILGIILVTDREMRAGWIAANGWIWIALALSVGVVILGVIMLSFRTVKLTVGALLFGLLISSYWTEIVDEKIAVVSIVFLLITVLFEEIRYRERQGVQIRSFVVRIVPFLLIGMIGLYYLPASSEPYNWTMARRLINKIADDITNLIQSFEGDSSSDMDASLGFSEKAKIGGNLSSEPEEMMTVFLGYDAPDYIYLDGKYFEDFDGREWTEAKETYPYMMDTVEACCSASMIDSKLSHDYSRTIEATITYTGQNTKYVFAPIKSLISGVRVKDAELSYSDNEILFDKKRGNNTHYIFRYLLINQNENTLPVLVENGELIDENRWNRECASLGLWDDIYSYEEFLRYRSRLYDNSLCPNAISKSDMSERVQSFLDEAVADAETDFDKLVALENAFSYFEYTTSPGALPEKVVTPADFLDYFLFESRRGYCNSYATAFILLCRAEGIPARYVHGYFVPVNDHGVTVVYSNMAHAYPEAYIEGIGWTVFEPTPGFSARMVWDEKGEYKIPEYSYMPGMNSSYAPIVGSEPAADSETGMRITWYMIVIPVLLCLFVLTLIIIVERIINLRRFDRLSREEKAHVVCLRMMTMLKGQGFVKAEHETVHEYAVRAYEEKGISLKGFADSFEKILYSSEGLEEKDVAELDEEYGAIRDGLKGKDKAFYLLRKLMGLI